MTLLIFMCPSGAWQGRECREKEGPVSCFTYIISISLQWASQAFQLLSALSENRWCKEQKVKRQKRRREWEREIFWGKCIFPVLSLLLQLPKGCVRDLCQALCVVLSPSFVLGISLPCCWFGSSMLAHFLSHSSLTYTHKHTHAHTHTCTQITHMGWGLLVTRSF